MRRFLLMALIVLSLSSRAIAQGAARAESERAAAESKRTAAESKRFAAESARWAAESKRLRLEKLGPNTKQVPPAAVSTNNSSSKEPSAAESARQAKESEKLVEILVQVARELPRVSLPAPAPPQVPLSPQSDSPSTRSPSKPWTTRTVSVRPIDDSASDQADEAGTRGESTESPVASYSFSRAAHFAWLSFDREEQPLPRDVLTIYEGMTIDVFHGGNYEVRYQVEAPLVETTLRMQLQFRTNSNNKVGTVTLAPVNIHEGRNEDRHVSSQSYQVVQRGHSVALSRAAYHLREDINVIDTLPLPPFTRTGTTRFGAVPQK